jgi:predicted O-methyltransferase YrrM
VSISEEFLELRQTSFIDPMHGQIEAVEAHALYAHIRGSRPAVVIEIGTATGGGTTYWIASALDKNEHGMLHTIEIHRGKYHWATARYRQEMPHLLRRICFHLGNSVELLPHIAAGRHVDFAMIDGGSGDVPVQEIKALEDRILPGSSIAVHDWYFDGKTGKVKRYLLGSDKWRLLMEVGPDNLPDVLLLNFDQEASPGGIVKTITGIAFLERTVEGT